MFATGALGPVLGFALGALILQYYVDTFSYDVKDLHLTTIDPQWVGAWWAGFIICGGLLLFIAVPFFTFPKILHKEKAKLMNDKVENMEVLLNEKKKQQGENYGRTIKGNVTVLVLIYGLIYMYICVLKNMKNAIREKIIRNLKM